MNVPAPAYEGWFSEESRHFTAYFRDPSARAEAEDVLRAAEVFRDRLNQKWKPFRPWSFWRQGGPRCSIYLFQSKRDFLETTRRPSWSRSAAVDAEEKIIALSRDSPTLMRAELPHEIAHLYFRQWLGVSGPVPVWIEEGVALAEEELPADKLDAVLESRIAQRRTIPMKELLERTRLQDLDQNSVALFYAQSRSLVIFLTERFGPSRFLALARLLGRKTPLTSAWQQAFDLPFPGFDGLEDQWLSHLAR
ncbi:MAG: hypothetical protein HY714_04785 [Candidatus Omnitrophica bacterium]|nr:hypothetical protein [Candidatus Omnitrophota bacterium]